MRYPIALLLIAPMVLTATPSWAQSTPSSDQIINSLKPSGNLVTGGTRGIRLAAPTTETATHPATPVATSAPAHAAQSAVKSASASQAVAGPSINLTVNFATGSTELTPQAKRVLDQLGKALASNDLANYKFRIEGHTDTVGSKQANLELSQRRAEAVVSYITAQFGVQASRLQAVGMGEDGLLVQTGAQTPEARNRRVQVINLGA
ncbi:MAG TPA: OmpA family protein [Acetobacteraceae bacterium]|jgi:outer membrane protein OmpA-like peptidoglycan-associated protein